MKNPEEKPVRLLSIQLKTEYLSGLFKRWFTSYFNQDYPQMAYIEREILRTYETIKTLMELEDLEGD